MAVLFVPVCWMDPPRFDKAAALMLICCAVICEICVADNASLRTVPPGAALFAC
ncbi:hypothetical protein [Burkholderia pyrrocinia]|uniref:hypothetical protein n=1 Tax=Burkholderia pyrrocinia TaxID=60550 RepID=UPI003CC80CDE